MFAYWQHRAPRLEFPEPSKIPLIKPYTLHVLRGFPIIYSVFHKSSYRTLMETLTDPLEEPIQMDFLKYSRRIVKAVDVLGLTV